MNFFEYSNDRYVFFSIVDVSFFNATMEFFKIKFVFVMNL
jgi:hypothetical protein